VGGGGVTLPLHFRQFPNMGPAEAQLLLGASDCDGTQSNCGAMAHLAVAPHAPECLSACIVCSRLHLQLQFNCACATR